MAGLCRASREESEDGEAETMIKTTQENSMHLEYAKLTG